VVVVIIGPPQDALFGAVLVVNTGIGVAQELRAKRALDRLAILVAGRARAVRDGTVTEIALDRIVLGEILELARGDQVPVDGTVLCDDGLELDEALLTGEAEPVHKQPGDPDLSGGVVVAGTGRIRATGVGADAYAARLQAQARRAPALPDLAAPATRRARRPCWPCSLWACGFSPPSPGARRSAGSSWSRRWPAA
jgi:cation-transporting ATPase E